MKAALLLLCMATVVLFIMGILQALFLSDRRIQKRMDRYLALGEQKKLARRKFNMLVRWQMYKQSIGKQMVGKKKKERLANLLSRAGMQMNPVEFVLFRWLFVALAGGCLYLLTGHFPLLAVGAVLGRLAPGWWVRRLVRRRLHAFNEGLPDMVATIVGSLRAGFSLPQSLKAVAEEADSPIREEIETVLKEMQYGMTLEDALQQLINRMPSEDLELMIQSILIQKQVGGNLAVVLETIVSTIRDRNKINRQIRTLTAQGRLSGVVVGLLPAGVGGVIFAISPDYMSRFLGNPIGMGMIGAGAVSSVIGFLLIRKITKIEV